MICRLSCMSDHKQTTLIASLPDTAHCVDSFSQSLSAAKEKYTRSLSSSFVVQIMRNARVKLEPLRRKIKENRHIEKHLAALFSSRIETDMSFFSNFASFLDDLATIFRSNPATSHQIYHSSYHCTCMAHQSIMLFSLFVSLPIFLIRLRM